MRRCLCVVALAVGLALPALLPAMAGVAAQPTILAQADNQPEPAEDHPDPPAKSRKPSDRASEQAPKFRHGEVRRLDPFDAVDDAARTPHPAALAHPGDDVVVCEAGCDQSAGAVVYKKRRE